MIIRPNSFNGIIGQESIIDSLKIAIHSANRRGDSLSHILISGPPGLGKTTICNAIANELKVEKKTLFGGNIKSIKDILPTIVQMGHREILFIDEIHRLSLKLEESFYSIMEDFRLDIPSPKDINTITTINLPRFTVLGATTDIGILSAPMRDRFKLKFVLSQYSIESLTNIILNTSAKLKIKFDSLDTVYFIAKVSRGTPRVANSIVEWIRDCLIYNNKNTANLDLVKEAISKLGIDENGYDLNDKKYIEFIRKQNNPVGLSTLTASLNINQDTIEYVIEPFLLQNGVIAKGPKGRYYVGQ